MKSYTDAKNPTIKGASGGKIPMPEGPKRDAQIKKNLKALDDKIARQAKLPKGTYIPKGGVFPKSTFPTDAKWKPQILKGIKDKKTGKIKPPTKVKVSDKLSVPFEPKETNIQFKSDKLDLDYGKRFSQRDGLTDAERKRKLKKLQRDLAAMDLKEAVLGFNKDTISGINNYRQNAFYLGMRGTIYTEQKGALHSALGRLNLKDFDNKAKGLKQIKEDLNT